MGQRRSRHSHWVDGAVVEPTTLAGSPALPDGQIQPVTDQRYRLGVRRDGEIGPAVPLETSGTIAMTIDPSGGTSPAAGTVVTNQDEYDALGDDLLYVNDVLDILPQSIDRPVVVSMGSGTYGAKPGSSGIGGFNVLVGSSFGRTAAPAATPADSLSTLGNSLIIFRGTANNVLDSAQSGTSTASTIVRSSGTWTAHTQRGNYALITAGPAAGSRVLIYDNDTTTLYLQLDLSSTGSITFEIVEPAAVMYDAAALYAMLLYHGFSTLQFDWVKWGTDSTPVGTFVVGGNVVFEDNKIHCSADISGIGTMVPSEVFFWKSYLDVKTIVASSMVGMRVQGCVVEKTDTAGFPLQASAGYTEVVGSAFINEESNSYTGAMIRVDAGAHLHFPGISSGSSRILGDDSADGIQVLQGGCFTMDSSAPLDIDDCDVCLDIQGDVSLPVAITGSSNATALKVSKGAKLVVADPTGLAATTEIDLDGTTHDYTELPSGSFIDGSGGSRIVRT